MIEPPVGARVMDESGHAWERTSDGWVCVDHRDDDYVWSWVLIEADATGPLTLIHHSP